MPPIRTHSKVPSLVPSEGSLSSSPPLQTPVAADRQPYPSRRTVAPGNSSGAPAKLILTKDWRTSNVEVRQSAPAKRAKPKNPPSHRRPKRGPIGKSAIPLDGIDISNDDDIRNPLHSGSSKLHIENSHHPQQRQEDHGSSVPLHQIYQSQPFSGPVTTCHMPVIPTVAFGIQGMSNVDFPYLPFVPQEIHPSAILFEDLFPEMNTLTEVSTSVSQPEIEHHQMGSQDIDIRALFDDDDFYRLLAIADSETESQYQLPSASTSAFSFP